MSAWVGTDPWVGSDSWTASHTDPAKVASGGSTAGMTAFADGFGRTIRSGGSQPGVSAGGLGGGYTRRRAGSTANLTTNTQAKAFGYKVARAGSLVETTITASGGSGTYVLLGGATSLVGVRAEGAFIPFTRNVVVKAFLDAPRRRVVAFTPRHRLAILEEQA